MSATIAALPPAQRTALLRAYEAAVAAKRRRFMLGAAVLFLLVLVAGHTAEVDARKFFANIGNFTNYIARLFVLDNGASVLTDPAEWFWGLDKWLKLMGETVLIAYVGTMLGAIGAFALCFAASRNLTRSGAVVWTARRFLEFTRTVPEIVFALIFVVSFGLGPVPGVLAIAIHTMGALGKLFAEVVENIDMKPVEGVAASGGDWFAQVRFAALPQVLSNFASYGLLRFEINVRGAAVMGFVGAGGIGQTLVESIRKFYYSDVSALLILIIATVMIIDAATEILRRRLIGAENRP
jgi:phosphonate transport system permease protein